MAALPNLGATADPTAPLPLPAAAAPPSAFPALANPRELDAFLVGDRDGDLIAMGGLRSRDAGRAELVYIRVHPAVRRQGVGRRLMSALEKRAATLGYSRAVLNTATNQPEAVAFYRALGYHDVGTETRIGWDWTLVHFEKTLVAG